MRIFTRYLLRQFMTIAVLCIGVFISLFFIIDLFDKADRMFSEHGSTQLLLQYLFYSIPPIVYFMLPATVLLATLLSLSIMSKNNEMVALRAGGYNLFRLLVPLLFIAALVSIGLYQLNENINPYCRSKTREIWEYRLKGAKRDLLNRRENIWSQTGEMIFHADQFDPVAYTLSDIELFVVDKAFAPQSRTVAERAYWDGESWVAVGLETMTFLEEGKIELTPTAAKRYDFNIGFSDLNDEEKSTEEMNRRQLGRHIERLERTGYDPSPYKVDYYFKIAFPLAPIILVLIAFPFGVRTGRFAGVTTGIFIGFLFGSGYWVVSALATSFGRSGVLPPPAAAWITNIIFSFASIISLKRMGR